MNPPQLENRAYGPDSSPEEVENLRAQIYLEKPDLLIYNEAPVLSDFQLQIYAERFLELAHSAGEFDLVINLLNAPRPDARQREKLRKLFASAPNLRHCAVYTGLNAIMNVAARFVVQGLGLGQAAVRKTREDALKAIGHG